MAFSSASHGPVSGTPTGASSASYSDPGQVALFIPKNSQSAASFAGVETTSRSSTSAASNQELDFIGPTFSAASSQDSEFFSKGIHGTQIQEETIPADRLEP